MINGCCFPIQAESLCEVWNGDADREDSDRVCTSKYFSYLIHRVQYEQKDFLGPIFLVKCPHH